MTETVYVLELDDSGIKKIFRSEARAREEMLKCWYEGYAKNAFEKMAELIKDWKGEFRAPYDAEDLESYIITLQHDLECYLKEGYLDGFAWVYPAELEE